MTPSFPQAHAGDPSLALSMFDTPCATPKEQLTDAQLSNGRGPALVSWERPWAHMGQESRHQCFSLAGSRQVVQRRISYVIKGPRSESQLDNADMSSHWPFFFFLPLPLFRCLELPPLPQNKQTKKQLLSHKPLPVGYP